MFFQRVSLALFAVGCSLHFYAYTFHIPAFNRLNIPFISGVKDTVSGYLRFSFLWRGGSKRAKRHSEWDSLEIDYLHRANEATYPFFPVMAFHFLPHFLLLASMSDFFMFFFLCINDGGYSLSYIDTRKFSPYFHAVYPFFSFISFYGYRDAYPISCFLFRGA